MGPVALAAPTGPPVLPALHVPGFVEIAPAIALYALNGWHVPSLWTPSSVPPGHPAWLYTVICASHVPADAVHVHALQLR